MNSPTLLVFVVALAYILWPGFFMNVGDLCILAWKNTKLEIRRYILLWGMKRQLDKDRRELEKWVNSYRKEVHQDDDVVQ